MEVEFKRDTRSGETLIIEPNMGRATGRCGLAEGSGVEFLYTMYCDLAGLPLPENRDQPYRGTKWIFLRRDLLSAIYYWRRGDLSIADWWRSLRGPKVFALLSLRDPFPFLIDFIRTIVRAFSRLERRKLR